MSQSTDASVKLAQLAASEDWTAWNRVALDKLAAEIGVNGADTLPGRDQVVAAIHARIQEHERATVPDAQAAPKASAYRVIGPHRVCGTAPGKTFVHLYTPEQEAALIQGGHITPVKERN